jgi:hypothetical protein
MGDWVGSRASLDSVEKNLLSQPEIEPQSLCRPAHRPVTISAKTVQFQYRFYMIKMQLIPVRDLNEPHLNVFYKWYSSL